MTGRVTRRRAWLGALLHLGTEGGHECRGEDERKEASVLTRGSAPLHRRVVVGACGGASILLTQPHCRRWEGELEK